MKADGFPDFNHPVPTTGYQWWYVDGSSDDGRHHLVMIAFVGSVFSPHYFRAIQRGQGEPEQYCAMNVGIYSRGQRRWVLSEYDATRIQRDAREFRLGGNTLRFDGTALVIEVDDVAVPLPRRVRGTIRVEPEYQTPAPIVLHKSGDQHWWPYAPSAKIEARFEQPSLRWRGHGYFDTNSGAIPLQACFRDWHWSRRHDDGDTHITYLTRDTNNVATDLAIRIGQNGSVETKPTPPVSALPRGLWRMHRPIATKSTPQLVATLEDAPFYTRSVVATPERGQTLTMHESLSLERFVEPWVQRLLPFRTRRDVA